MHPVRPSSDHEAVPLLPLNGVYGSGGELLRADRPSKWARMDRNLWSACIRFLTPKDATLCSRLCTSINATFSEAFWNKNSLPYRVYQKEISALKKKCGDAWTHREWSLLREKLKRDLDLFGEKYLNIPPPPRLSSIRQLGEGRIFRELLYNLYHKHRGGREFWARKLDLEEESCRKCLLPIADKCNMGWGEWIGSTLCCALLGGCVTASAFGCGAPISSPAMMIGSFVCSPTSAASIGLLRRKSFLAQKERLKTIKSMASEEVQKIVTQSLPTIIRQILASRDREPIQNLQAGLYFKLSELIEYVDCLRKSGSSPCGITPLSREIAQRLRHSTSLPPHRYIWLLNKARLLLCPTKDRPSEVQEWEGSLSAEETLLQTALQTKDLGRAEKLIVEHLIDINQPPWDGFLLRACMQQEEEIVRLFVRMGADLEFIPRSAKRAQKNTSVSLTFLTLQQLLSAGIFANDEKMLDRLCREYRYDLAFVFFLYGLSSPEIEKHMSRCIFATYYKLQEMQKEILDKDPSLTGEALCHASVEGILKDRFFRIDLAPALRDMNLKEEVLKQPHMRLRLFLEVLSWRVRG